MDEKKQTKERFTLWLKRFKKDECLCISSEVVYHLYQAFLAGMKYQELLDTDLTDLSDSDNDELETLSDSENC